MIEDVTQGSNSSVGDAVVGDTDGEIVVGSNVGETVGVIDGVIDG